MVAQIGFESSRLGPGGTGQHVGERSTHPAVLLAGELGDELVDGMQPEGGEERLGCGRFVVTVAISEESEAINVDGDRAAAAVARARSRG